MTPDLQCEFESLRKAATHRLTDVADSASHRHVLSIWVRPSFTPPYRYTVYAPFSSAKLHQPYASYAVWRSDLDLGKVSNPLERLRHPKHLAPTIEEEMLCLTDADVEALLQRLRGISVPLYPGPPTVIGCDGTDFEFRWDETLYGASLRWWADGPSEWRPLTTAVAQIAGELERRRLSA